MYWLVYAVTIRLSVARYKVDRVYFICALQWKHKNGLFANNINNYYLL